MPILGFHVTFRLGDSRVIAPDTPAQRRLARAVLKAARPYTLLAFRCADTHGHLLFIGEEADIREAVRRALIATSRALRLPVPFSRPHLEPVFDQFHLDNTFHYILRQADHHGFAHDPFHDASNLPDLLGLRTVGAWCAGHVRARLPRVDRATLLGHLGAADLDARSPALAVLPEAAAAAIGRSALAGNSAPVCAARQAAVQVGRALARPGEVAAALGLAPRTVRKLAAAAPDPALQRAVLGQARLRSGPPPADPLGGA